MRLASLWILVGASLLQGCGSTAKCDSNDICDSVGDTFGTVQEADLKVDTLGYTFTSASWVYQVHLEGWADAVQLSIYWTDDSDELEEIHDFHQIDYDPNGAWDEWGSTLEIVEEDPGNEQTVFTASQEAGMTWMAAAYKSGAFIDCGVKAGAKGSIDHWSVYGCHEI